MASRDECAFRNFQAVLQQLQAWEDEGEIDLYYFDESGFSQKTNLPYAWSRRGVPLTQTAFSHSKRLNVLGFLSRHHDPYFQTTTGKVDAATVIAAFNGFAARKPPDRLTVVILDNASMHTSKKFLRETKQWLDQNIWPVHLPAYSPELNLIEILWKKMKYEWLPIDARSSFAHLTYCVEEMLSKIGQKYKIIFN